MRKKRKSFNPSVILVAAVMCLVIAYMVVRESQAQGRVKGYSLKFSPDFQSALSFRDDLGLSVVVAVDVSGSMADRPSTGPQVAKYIQASGALTEVLKVLGGLVAPQKGGTSLLVKFSLISFADEVRVLLPPTVLTPASLGPLEAFAAVPENFKPGGSTAIGAAVEKGTEILAQSGTIMRSLIVITDGENTAGIVPESVLDAVYANRNSATTAEVPVTTSSTLVSFIGFDIDASRFAGLAEKGARVTGASDQAQLVAELRGLLEADITKLESAAGPGGH
jgi:hypothetical protein